MAVVSVGLLAAGFLLGQSRQPEPTEITVDAAPKAAFSSSGTDFHEMKAGGAVRSLATPTNGVVVIVRNGESIQEAVSAAEPGTVIKVMPGTYEETVYIDKDNITLSGVIERGEYPVLEGGRVAQ